MKKVLIISLIATVFTSCTSDDLVPSLAETYKNYFPVGVGVTRSSIRSINDTSLIKRHFNSITAMEEMQPQRIHPRASRWLWRMPDEMVDFAQRNKMKVRYNCLVSPEAMPDWILFDGEKITSRDSLYSRIKNHIETVMKRYKGKIDSWDVVCGAIADDSTINLRQNTWLYQIAGNDYVEFAFRCAHNADSTAKLFYNDYNLTRPDKLERTYQMLKSLIDKGVHIDGVGMQGHWSIYEPTAAQLDTAIARFRSLGLQVHVTQLDVSLYKWERNRGRHLRRNETLRLTDSIRIQQTNQYSMIFNVLRKNADVVTNVTIWGIDDRSSWLNNNPVRGRKNYPLLFDAYRGPKSAFYRIIRDAE